MSRTPKMNDDDYQGVLARLTAWGFDVAKLQKVRQEW
jgi:lipocalin